MEIGRALAPRVLFRVNRRFLLAKITFMENDIIPPEVTLPFLTQMTIFPINETTAGENADGLRFNYRYAAITSEIGRSSSLGAIFNALPFSYFTNENLKERKKKKKKNTYRKKAKEKKKGPAFILPSAAFLTEETFLFSRFVRGGVLPLSYLGGIARRGKSSRFNGDDRESSIDARPTENRKTVMPGEGRGGGGGEGEVAEGRKVVEGC
ncbi:hypothetical protein PUN28_017245 [Cardiocondyla obscurior]|uniref:Uncharacterized protein n=1 Tax=Cardiocondyla obscurior TaxID=286306 RepID=A0AAW2EKX9_9HYME